MTFRVEWLQTALNELARVWMQADSEQRRLITRAASTIDLRLQNNPSAEGESRPDNQFILFELPLGITFEIRQAEQIVRVLHVWYVRSRVP